MTGLLASLLVVAAVGAVMLALALLALHVRRTGRAVPAIGAAMTAYDEAMHASACDAFVEVQSQDDRVAPIPSAADR